MHPTLKGAMFDRIFPRRAAVDIAAILSGLATTQLVASLATHFSNLHVYNAVADLQAAGWFAIPAGPALALLPTLGAALRGGLFFTLSIGAGLTLLTWAAARLVRRFFPRNRLFKWGVLLAAAVELIYVNTRGFAWFPSLAVLGITLTTGLIAGRRPHTPVFGKRWWAPLGVLLILTGLWATQLNRGLFITIRDHLLLSNRIGSSVNDFYYRNTLYAAEVFKSFNQKSLRICRMKGPGRFVPVQQLTAQLAKWDVLNVQGNATADLTIVWPSPDDQRALPGKASAMDQITLITHNGRELRTTVDALMKNTRQWLAEVSERGDNYAPFRRITFLGLLIGFPILLYLSIYALIRWATGLFFNDIRATEAAALVCLAIGIGLFIPMLGKKSSETDTSRLDSLLREGSWTQRVAAMQQIEKKKLEIARFPGYRGILKTGTVVERYYLARVLALSHDAGTYADLLSLVSDRHINVICQTYYALGQRGNPSAISLIKSRIPQTSYWYAQFYGYRALRKLGWRQTPLKPEP